MCCLLGKRAKEMPAEDGWRSFVYSWCFYCQPLTSTVIITSGNLAEVFSVDFWELLTNLMSVHGLFRVDGYGSFGYSFVYYSWVINRPPFISTNVICSGNWTELLLIDLGNEMNIYQLFTGEPPFFPRCEDRCGNQISWFCDPLKCRQNLKPLSYCAFQ